jgi:hypothetical protein
VCCAAEAFFSIAGLLLGEIAPSGMVDLAPWGTTAGATGILIWYTWYTTAKTIPSMNRAHSAEQKEAREAYAAQLSKQLDAFTAQQNRQLDVFTSQIEKERAHADSQLRSVLDEMKRERDSWREVRHTLRGSVTEAELAKELLKQQQRPGDSGIITRS